MAYQKITPANRRELEVNLRKLWNRGANVIVGWRVDSGQMRVLTLSSHAVPLLGKAHPELFELDRYIRDRARFEKLTKFGCRESNFTMQYDADVNDQSIASVNEVVRFYSVTRFDARAVALFDIVSFSVHSPFEQITQISVLSFYIRQAVDRCRALGMLVETSMTTTGDGFYVWNRHEGLAADMAFFCAIMLALGQISAARKLADKEMLSIPRLRCGIHFGSYYEYYQTGGDGAEASGFIVGDVTIDLARLIGKARTSQFLIGSHRRKLGPQDSELAEAIGVDEIDTLLLLALVQNELKRLEGVAIPGSKIKHVQVFFTGPRLSETSFSIRNYHIVDKHGLRHGCYNAKLDIETEKDEQISFGLLDKDLTHFDAHSDPREDIVIDMR